MIYIVGAILVLGPLIFVHELGHFLAAKMFGVRVERFSIGFPPRLFGIQIGETDYCISAVPIGGYVKMSGMIDESMDENVTLTGADYEFMSKPMYQKVIIITAGVIMNFLLAVVILGGFAYVQGEAILPTTTIGAVPDTSLAYEIGLRAHDEIVEIGGQPVENWQDITEIFLDRLGEDLPFIINRDGEMRELHFPGSSIAVEDLQRLNIFPLRPARVGEVLDGAPAAEAGLQRGDWIMAINDSAVTNWNEMAAIISTQPDVPLTFDIKRGDEQLKINMTPALSESDSSGRIGIGQYFEFRDISLLGAAAIGFERSMLIVDVHIKVFQWIFSGRAKVQETLGGPVMIAEMAGQAVNIGPERVIEMIAQLSVVLAFINILPFPALDGGHLMIILIEGIRRKPLPTKGKLMVQQVGMFLLLLLIVFVFYNDIARIINR